MKHSFRKMAATAGAVAAVLAATAASDVLAKDKKSVKVTKEKAKAESGYIGVYMQELTDDVRKGLDLDVKKGVLISGVQDDSPAAQAGLEEGDVVTSFAGKSVSTPEELREAVGGFKPGAEAKLEAVRDGQAQTFTVTIGERPERDTFEFLTPDVDAPGLRDMHRAFAMFGGPRLGVQAHELEDDELGAYFGAKEGVLVLGVEDESVAAKAGVKAGDVIQSIGDDPVTDVGDLREALRDFDAGDEFTISVLRRGKTQSLQATMDEQEFSFHDGQSPMWQRAPRAPRTPHAPRVMMNRDSLREEIDALKKEIREMKEQLEREDS